MAVEFTPLANKLRMAVEAEEEAKRQMIAEKTDAFQKSVKRKKQNMVTVKPPPASSELAPEVARALERKKSKFNSYPAAISLSKKKIVHVSTPPIPYSSLSPAYKELNLPPSSNVDNSTTERRTYQQPSHPFAYSFSNPENPSFSTNSFSFKTNKTPILITYNNPKR